NRSTDLSEFDTAALDKMLAELEPELRKAAGFLTIEDLDPAVDFKPEDDQTRLDELNPQIVMCPFCKKEFDVRKNNAKVAGCTV
ncbi:MAG TPA: hypothetical protein DDW84_01355, partial [Phycisphaerales bacterium]|nr:hypothetical protein [Phycisphaerales bacterium]HBR19091.1 hypothetical protein [Phycisphaerales bacterium]